MTFTSMIKTFAANESGAVTVDWVVLTAAMVGLGIGATLTVSGGMADLSQDISDEMTTNALLFETDFSASRLTNGGFEDSTRNSAVGWGGVDIEILAAGVYIPGAGSSMVAELDGWIVGETTVLQQGFTVDGPTSTVVSFTAALRSAVAVPNETDGLLVEVIDRDGNALAQMPVIPNSRNFEEYRMPVRFAEAGEYALRMTEIGTNDTLGAIVDDVVIK